MVQRLILNRWGIFLPFPPPSERPGLLLLLLDKLDGCREDPGVFLLSFPLREPIFPDNCTRDPGGPHGLLCPMRYHWPRVATEHLERG